MSDGPNIDIKLTTTADTSGAEKVEKSIFGVVDASRAAQQQADIALIKARQADAAAAQQQAASMREMVVAQRALVGIQAAQELAKVGKELAGVVPAGSAAKAAIEGATESLGLFQTGINTFIATKNPLLAIGATLYAGVTKVRTAWREMNVEVEKNKTHSEQFKKNFVDAATAHKALARSITHDAIPEKLDEATRAAKRLNDELGRKDKLAQAQASLDVAESTAAGMPADQQALQGMKAMASQMERDQEMAANELDALRTAYDLQKETLESFPEDEKKEVLDQAVQKLHAIGDDIDAARAALENQDQINVTQLREMSVKASADVTAGAESTITGIATGAMEAMQKTADAHGGKLKADAAGAMDRLAELMADAIPDSKQVGAIDQAIKQFRGSQSTLLAGMVANFDDLLKDSHDVVAEVARQRGELSALRSQIETLRNR